MTLTRSEIDRSVALGRSVHARLLRRLTDLRDSGELDASGSSRLPGWTRAHVITHLARNADGHRRMIEGAGRGEVSEQYVGGVDGRSAEIEAGSERSAAELVEDLTTAIGALETAWDSTDWSGRGRRTIGGESPIDRLPFLRSREVSLHGVDLDVGMELDDLDPLYVRLELTRLEMLWTARQPMGMTPLPTRALQLAPSDRLGWLTGRLEVEGLPATGIF